MSGTAAFVRNGRLDIVTSNLLGRALYSPVLDQPAHRANIARFNFLDPRAGDYYRWGTHDVRLHHGGVKTFNHPAVGYMELAYDSMELVGAPGLVLTAYTAEPATASADNLALLATWAATEADAQPAPDSDKVAGHRTAQQS